jgi:hypothetical protein
MGKTYSLEVFTIILKTYPLEVGFDHFSAPKR